MKHAHWLTSLTCVIALVFVAACGSDAEKVGTPGNNGATNNGTANNGGTNNGGTNNGERECSTDDDCPLPTECVANFCVESEEDTTCIDDDSDGYGANTLDADRQDCPKCEIPDMTCMSNENCCAIDPNDADPEIHPNATESCDGVDNDGDEEIDEPTPCASVVDCPTAPPAGTTYSCDNAAGNICSDEPDCVCVLLPENQTEPACQEPLECVEGSYETPPAECL